MRDLHDRLNDTIRILFSQERSIKSLAQISDFDTATFFRGASLRGLDLRGQDLTGLNFDGADFFNTQLDDIKYDQGAFNNAIVEQKYDALVDEFDVYLSDLCQRENSHLFAFVRFRPQSLENQIAQVMMSYGQLASLAGINPITLRKARRGQVVALSTAYAIAQSLIESKEKYNQHVVGFLPFGADQPMANILSVNPDGGFNRIYRTNYLRLLQIIDDNIGSSSINSFKSGPSFLEIIERLGLFDASLSDDNQS